MITTDLLKRKQSDEVTSEKERVSLSTLSKMTGFPLEFIKKELLVQGDSLSMSELRESVLDYLSRSDEGYSKNN